MAGTKETPRKSPDVRGFARQYELKRPMYVEFTEKVKGLLQDILHIANVRYQVVEHRTKEVPSFREKITRANKQYSNPLQEITDLSGLRIIVYYSDDVETVCKLIEREFNVDKNVSIDKGTLLQPNEFGYRSVHYIVSLSATRNKLPEWQSYKDLTAEIQVRTVLQHAWAAISHALQYKNEQDVPSIFRRRLSRLSGLLELSDEEFSDLRNDQKAFSKVVSAKIGKGNTALELNSITLAEYSKESEPLSFLMDAAANAGFKIGDLGEKYASQLIKMCSLSGVVTVDGLDRLLNTSKPWAEQYLREVRNRSETDWIAPMLFVAILIVIRAHRDKIDIEFLEAEGWNKGIAALVVEAAQVNP